MQAGHETRISTDKEGLYSELEDQQAEVGSRTRISLGNWGKNTTPVYQNRKNTRNVLDCHVGMAT